MTIVIVLAVVLVLAFGFVVLFGAPYVPTLKLQTTDALDLLDLRPGQVLVELGSGDGRLQREAARRGIYSVGYEINPALVLIAHLRNWKYRKFITTKWGNFWKTPLSQQTDAVYVFLLNKYMDKLDKKIAQDMVAWESKKRLKVVSFAFEIPEKKPVSQRNGLFMYLY